MFATQFVLDRFGLFKCNTFDGWKRRTQKLFIHILRYCISHSIYTKLTYSMANSIFFLVFRCSKARHLYSLILFVCVYYVLYMCIGLCYTFHFWSSVAVATIASYYPTARKPIWILSLWQIFECVNFVFNNFLRLQLDYLRMLIIELFLKKRKYYFFKSNDFKFLSFISLFVRLLK